MGVSALSRPRWDFVLFIYLFFEWILSIIIHFEGVTFALRNRVPKSSLPSSLPLHHV